MACHAQVAAEARKRKGLRDDSGVWCWCGTCVKCGKVVVLKCFGYLLWPGLVWKFRGNPPKTIGLSSHSPSDCNFVGAPWCHAPTWVAPRYPCLGQHGHDMAWYGWPMTHDPLCIDRSQARCCEPTVASYLAPSIVLEHGPCLLLPTMMSGLCLTHLEAIWLLLGGKTGRWLRMDLSILLNFGMESHGPTAHTGSQIEWYWRHKLYKHLCIVGPGLPCAYCRFDAVAVILLMGLKNHMWLGRKVLDHHTWPMILPLRGPYGDVCFQAPADIVVVADGTLEMRRTRVMRISPRCCSTMAIHGHPWRNKKRQQSFQSRHWIQRWGCGCLG